MDMRAPDCVRKRPYPGPRDRNSTDGSAWPRLGSKVTGRLERRARARDLSFGSGDTRACRASARVERRSVETGKPAADPPKFAPALFCIVRS